MHIYIYKYISLFFICIDLYPFSRLYSVCETGCLQSGVGLGLAGDASLDDGLVDPVDAQPREGAPDGQRPEGVASQRVGVEAEGGTGWLFDSQGHWWT